MGGLHLLALVCLVFIQNCCASEKRTDALTDVEEKVLGKLVDRVKDNPKYRDELRRLLGDDVSKRQECEDLSDFAPGIEPAVNIGREERIARAGRLHENDEPSQHLKFNVQTGAAEEVLAEGDMKLIPEQYDELYGNNTLTKRKGMRATRYRWTNKVIPYQISGFSGNDLSEINAAIADWNGFTCLNFRQRRSSDASYVYINKQASGCWSYVGMVFSGQQKLNLGRGCTTKDIAIHELGHTIGLQHEQSRHDRDQHVTVYFNRIKGGKGEDDVNFKKYNADQMIYGGLPYDYTSIMHYSEAAFSANGQPTIEAHDSKYQKLMGNGKGLSFPDVKLVNIMYECGSHCTGTCPNDGYHDENCVCQCKSDTTPFDHCGHVPIKPCDGSAYQGPAPEACPECTDIHNVPTCNNYKNIGGCGLDSRYRQDAWTNCYKTCSGCATGVPGGSGGGSPAPDCSDKKSACSYWKGLGYCTTSSYVSYMTENCKKTCNLC